jgi:hypothetical protein
MKNKLLKSLLAIVTLVFVSGAALANIPSDWLPFIADTLHISLDTLSNFMAWYAPTGLSLAVGYYPACGETEIPDHSCDPCAEREYGRIRSAGFIHKDFQFADGDTENTLEWARGINERKIYVVPDTNGEMPEPSEKTGPGYGDTTETLLGYDFSAKFMDPNYSENVDFYNSLIGNRNFKFFYRTSSKVHITQTPVTIIPKTQIQNDLNSEVVWGTSVKWMHNQFPIPFNTPEGIFNTCFVPSE